jgi:hypothetical protein
MPGVEKVQENFQSHLLPGEARVSFQLFVQKLNEIQKQITVE